jgi:hypothetical protein
MPNDEHVALPKKGADAWNKWRNENTSVRPDLSGPKLSGRDLNCANLNQAKLNGAHLDGTSLGGADLSAADLSGTVLSKARLTMANLSAADLSGADLRGADLRGANICGANLTVATMTGADLREAVLADTVFGHTMLSEVKGLDQCRHNGPSFIDFRTLDNSGPLPIAFLRGVGLSDRLIEYLPSILNEAIQYYSCFISHSSKDQAFAERLHADLQSKACAAGSPLTICQLGPRSSMPSTKRSGCEIRFCWFCPRVPSGVTGSRVR